MGGRRHDPGDTRNSPAARQPGAGIGFGFYEKALEDERPALCAACRVVDGGGCLLCHDRRRSPGWRTKDAPNYREGDRFLRFYLAGKTLAVMVCGDFWEEGLLKDLQALQDCADAFLWPVHCDDPLEEWEKRIKAEYVQRSLLLSKPVLFVNNLRLEPDRAKGALPFGGKAVP